VEEPRSGREEVTGEKLSAVTSTAVTSLAVTELSTPRLPPDAQEAHDDWSRRSLGSGRRSKRQQPISRGTRELEEWHVSFEPFIFIYTIEIMGETSTLASEHD
jgi:hypothetical protein